MSQKSKRIRIIAGPNGSGKTTVLRKIKVNYYSGPFVNADMIEVSLRQTGLFNPGLELNLAFTDKSFNSFKTGAGKSWINKAKSAKSPITLFSKRGVLFTSGKPHSYDAAMAADFMRDRLLAKGETFTFESVLSHPSKLDFLERSKKAGFKNYLYFICTVDPAMNIERVKHRYQLGGHDVPEEKIISRYYDSLKMLKDIIPLCYRCFFFDNTAKRGKDEISPVAEIDNKGKLIILQEKVPNWLTKYVFDPMYFKA